MKNRIVGILFVSLFSLILITTAFLTSACSNNSPSAPAPTPIPLSVAVSFGIGIMTNPSGIAISGNNIWVINQNGGTTNFQEWLTTGGSPVTTISSYGSPTTALGCNSVNIGPDEYIYVGDFNHYQVVEFSPALAYVSSFGNTYLQPSGANNIFLAVSPFVAYVLDGTNSQVIAYTITGSGNSKSFVSPVTFGNSGSGTLSNPKGICLDTSNNVYAADYSNKRIVKYNSNGVYQSAVTLTSLGVPIGVAVDTAGNIYALDTQNHDVQMFTSTGNPVTQFGASALSSSLGGIAVDSAENIWVSDSSNSQVLKFNHY